MSSTKLILKKSGLEVLTFDDELSSRTKIKRQENGTYAMIARDTGEVLYVGEDREQVRLKYYVLDENPNPYCTYLREPIDIDPDVTIEDFIRFLDETELSSLCDDWFEDWRTRYNAEQHLEVGVVFTIGDSFKTNYFTLVNTHPTDETPFIKQSPQANLYKDYELVATADWSFALITIIEALFSSSTPEPVYFGRGGLHLATGEKIQEPLEYAFHPVVLEDDVKLIDVFNYVAEDERFKAFIGLYSWCFAIDEFHKEASLPEEHSPHTETLSFAEVYRYFEQNGHKDTEWFSDDIGFHCMGPPSERDREVHKITCDLIAYSVSGSRVNEFANLPLKINETVEVSRRAKYSNKGNVKEPKEEYAKIPHSLTLLDFIDAIYWDISFYGGPKKRGEFMEELGNRADEIAFQLAESQPWYVSWWNKILTWVGFKKPTEKIKRFTNVEDFLKDLDGDD